ncbi:hypothetical protein NVIRENTERO_01374 [Sodalis praecaptivus]|nr:hypothetical protein NVIRENTERO_01374 [Sodalis praecaptivus]
MSVNNVSCRFPSTVNFCLMLKDERDCRKYYAFSHRRSLGREMPFTPFATPKRLGFNQYNEPGTPDPCAIEAFYNQCQDHESNTQGISRPQAEYMLFLKEAPMHYPPIARIIGLTDNSCFCPSTVVLRWVAAHASSELSKSDFTLKNSPSQIAGPPLLVPKVLARQRMSAPPQRKEGEVIRDETVSPLTLRRQRSVSGRCRRAAQAPRSIEDTVRTVTK